MNKKLVISAADETALKLKVLAEEKESVLRIKTIIDSMVEGVVVVDTGMHFELFNKSAERILGVGLSQEDPSKWATIYGVYLPDQITPLPADQFPLKKALKGEIVTGFLQYVKNNQRKDGLYINTTAAPLKDSNGRITGAVAVFRDVSKEQKIDKAKTKQLAATAKEKEDIRLKLVVTAEKLAIKAKELVATAKEKEAVRRNLAVTAKKLATTAREKESARGKLAVTAKEKEDVRLKLVVTAKELKESYSGLEQKVRDRTKDLRQAKAKDEALLESIGDGVIAIDAEGKIILMNQAAQTMLGWHPEEMTGKLLFDAVSIEDDNGNLIPREKRPIYLALAGTTTTTTTTTTTGPTYNYVRKDKTKFPVATKVTPIVVDNKIIGAIDVFRDITKEKEIDRAKSDFISVASHQLRTPMTSIKWVIERFLKVEHPTQKGKEYLDDIHMSITNLSSLVDLLLNVSRIEAGKIGAIPKPLELVEFIKIYLKEQEPLVEKKRLRVIFDQHPATFNVITDHITLRNIVHSLVSNALEYTPEGGEIEIRIAKKDNKFLLTIRDTGIGIPKEEQGHSFEKFFRGSNAKLIKTDGTGLGLYIAAQAVKLLQGKIWMESVIGKGSTFSVELPIESKSVTGEQSMS